MRRFAITMMLVTFSAAVWLSANKQSAPPAQRAAAVTFS